MSAKFLPQNIPDNITFTMYLFSVYLIRNQGWINLKALQKNELMIPIMGN